MDKIKMGLERNYCTPKRLGEILQEAGLVSRPQIQLALEDQNRLKELKIGEIIVLRGWLKQQTVEFFAQRWFKIIVESFYIYNPLGYYFRLSALLDSTQIDEILEVQKKIGLKFGYLAVLKGYLKQKTVDYFLENLIANRSQIRENSKQIVTALDFLKDGEVNSEKDTLIYEHIEGDRTITSHLETVVLADAEFNNIKDREIVHSPIWIDM